MISSICSATAVIYVYAKVYESRLKINDSCEHERISKKDTLYSDAQIITDFQ